jgi:thioredoxin reductase
MFDAIVVGGSYAGLAAALQLARARRRVLIIDSGQRRNRFVGAAHGFLGFDGVNPGEIQARGRADLAKYPTVEFRDAAVTEISGAQGAFRPGLQERWGKSVFVCPYCDGYELNLGSVGVIATGPNSFHHALIASEWGGPGKTTLFLNEILEPDAEQLAALAARSIQIVRGAVTKVTGPTTGEHAPATIHLADRAYDVAGIFAMPRTHIVGPFAAQLGCALEEGPLGPYYKTEMTKETTVPGVFACGDIALPMGSVSFAVADGARAGAGTHASLLFR